MLIPLNYREEEVTVGWKSGLLFIDHPKPGLPLSKRQSSFDTTCVAAQR